MLLPRSFHSRYHSCEHNVDGFPVSVFARKRHLDKTKAIYLHGGGFVFRYLSPSICGWLLDTVGVDELIVPLYGLAPNHTYKDFISLMDKIYEPLLGGGEDIMLVGDSAGGNLALMYAQHIANDRPEWRQPTSVVLFSPSLDPSNSNPDIWSQSTTTHSFSPLDVQLAASWFVEDDESLEASPLCTTLRPLGKVTGRIIVASGTSDSFHAQAVQLKKIAERENVPLVLLQYKGLFHDWVVYKSLPDTKETFADVLSVLISDRMRAGKFKVF
jgi:monoterpene epsilon-lactone hydrolase